MLWLPRAIYNDILTHCLREAPKEACGLVASCRPECRNADCKTHIWMHNVASDPLHYFSFDPRQQLETYEELDLNNLVPYVVYHSHPYTPPLPSQSDLTLAGEPGAHYLIVSLMAEKPEARSWLIKGRLAIAEEFTVMD